jgi:hypothetical protein
MNSRFFLGVRMRFENNPEAVIWDCKVWVLSLAQFFFGGLLVASRPEAREPRLSGLSTQDLPRILRSEKPSMIFFFFSLPHFPMPQAQDLPGGNMNCKLRTLSIWTRLVS